MSREIKPWLSLFFCLERFGDINQFHDTHSRLDVSTFILTSCSHFYFYLFLQWSICLYHLFFFFLSSCKMGFQWLHLTLTNWTADYIPHRYMWNQYEKIEKMSRLQHRTESLESSSDLKQLNSKFQNFSLHTL